MIDSDVMELAINHYGEQMQMDILIEEMAELTKELIKTKRRCHSGGEYALDRRVFEEMVDVQIVLDQMKLLFQNQFESVQDFENIYRAQRLSVLSELLYRIRSDKVMNK